MVHGEGVRDWKPHLRRKLGECPLPRSSAVSELSTKYNKGDCYYQGDYYC